MCIHTIVGWFLLHHKKFETYIVHPGEYQQLKVYFIKRFKF